MKQPNYPIQLTISRKILTESNAAVKESIRKEIVQQATSVNSYIERAWLHVSKISNMVYVSIRLLCLVVSGRKSV